MLTFELTATTRQALHACRVQSSEGLRVAAALELACGFVNLLPLAVVLEATDAVGSVQFNEHSQYVAETCSGNATPSLLQMSS
jgi:hypothetical protein